MFKKQKWSLYKGQNGFIVSFEFTLETFFLINCILYLHYSQIQREFLFKKFNCIFHYNMSEFTIRFYVNIWKVYFFLSYYLTIFPVKLFCRRFNWNWVFHILEVKFIFKKFLAACRFYKKLHENSSLPPDIRISLCLNLVRSTHMLW